MWEAHLCLYLFCPFFLSNLQDILCISCKLHLNLMLFICYLSFFWRNHLKVLLHLLKCHMLYLKILNTLYKWKAHTLQKLVFILYISHHLHLSQNKNSYHDEYLHQKIQGYLSKFFHFLMSNSLHLWHLRFLSFQE